MRVNLRQAMEALFEGKDKYSAPSVFVEQRGETYDLSKRPTVYSYGYHYPLVILVEPTVALVNETKYSQTTSTQQSGAAVFLGQKGFHKDPNRDVVHRGQQFSIYRA